MARKLTDAIRNPETDDLADLAVDAGPSDVTFDLDSLRLNPETFDIASLKLTPETFALDPSEIVLTHVPVRRPKRDEWIRTHPSEFFDAALFEVSETREIFIVLPKIAHGLAGDVAFKRLNPTINRSGKVFIWPIRLPSLDGRPLDDWSIGATRAAELGRTQWVRVASDQARSGYVVSRALIDLGEPTWPTETVDELVQLAFTGRIISDFDHPALKKLRGEA